MSSAKCRPFSEHYITHTDGLGYLIEAWWQMSLKSVTIGSGDGLSPVRCQSVTWTISDLLSIWPTVRNSSESKCRQMRLNISPVKFRPFFRAWYPIWALFNKSDRLYHYCKLGLLNCSSYVSNQPVTVEPSRKYIIVEPMALLTERVSLVGSVWHVIFASWMNEFHLKHARKISYCLFMKSFFHACKSAKQIRSNYHRCNAAQCHFINMV